MIASSARSAPLLAGPVVLAFFSGGYFDAPRAWAGLAAWVLVVIGLLTRPLPRSRAALLALGGLAGLAAWTLLSATWAPLAGSAWHAGQITLLYLGVTAAAALLCDARTTEPALAAGALLVVGYGLSERLLPGILHFTRSVSAEGRLEQPLTYWNGMGIVAAMGFVLCARLAGDAARDGRMRSAAAAAAVPLGLGLGLTVSRGALLAAGAGLLVIVVVAARREGLVAAAIAVTSGAIAAGVAAPLDGVASLTGAHREAEGAIVLVLLAVLMGGAVVVHRRTLGISGPLRLPAGAGILATTAVAVGFGLAVVLGSGDHARTLTPGAGRLITLQSNRYEYWRVATRAFGDQPLRGVGAGGWAVRWQAERPFREAAHDAHSLYLQTAAELGAVGVLLLLVWFGGVALAACAGPVGLAAVCVTWAVHVLLDWDFELPAASLPAMIAAGCLLGYSASATRGASRANTQTPSTQTAT